MSLDFTAHYLREINKGTKPAEAVRKVSERYTAGAPDEAQLAQIFHSALDYSPELRKLTQDTLKRANLLSSHKLNLSEDQREAQKKRILIVAEQFGLTFERTILITQEGFADEQQEAFQQYLSKDIPDACYTVSIGNLKVRRQMTLIKSGKDYFFTDPNAATCHRLIALQRNRTPPRF